jgi:NUMOD4 motif/HNH endonuclease
MQEVWRPVVGYEGLYEVSDHGRVRSLDRDLVHNNGFTRRYPGRVLATPPMQGYAFVSLAKEGKHKPRAVHQLVLEAFVGPRPDGLVCRHGPRGAACNELSNLSYGTPKENMADRKRDGTHTMGAQNPRARLTESQVLEILGDTRSGSVLAKVYGVHKNTIYAIKRRETWRNLHHHTLNLESPTLHRRSGAR